MIFPLTQLVKRLTAKSSCHCTRALYNNKMRLCNNFFQKNYICGFSVAISQQSSEGGPRGWSAYSVFLPIFHSVIDAIQSSQKSRYEQAYSQCPSGGVRPRGALPGESRN
jgi:hypothetical protein